MISPRKYIYGVDAEGNEEFLVTMLDLRDGVKYAEKHSKLFSGRFDKYIIGSMCDDKSNWFVYKTLSITYNTQRKIRKQY